MHTSSLQDKRPDLDGVLWPLSPEDDHRVRELFAEADQALIALARHFGRDSAGWDGTGLELRSYPSGNHSIASGVSVGLDGDNCVIFCLELRPSRSFGERSPTPAWEIEVSVEADCPGPSMITVREACRHATTALEAAAELRGAAFELLSIGSASTLEQWLQLGSSIYSQSVLPSGGGTPAVP